MKSTDIKLKLEKFSEKVESLEAENVFLVKLGKKWFLSKKIFFDKYIP